MPTVHGKSFLLCDEIQTEILHHAFGIGGLSVDATATRRQASATIVRGAAARRRSKCRLLVSQDRLSIPSSLLLLRIIKNSAKLQQH